MQAALAILGVTASLASAAPSPCAANNTRQIVIFGPWQGGDALLVNYTGPFLNDRPPHIQVGASELAKHKAGEVWCLDNCRAVGSSAIEYDVPGVYNARLNDVAHLTVFYGAGAASKVATYCAPLAGV